LLGQWGKSWGSNTYDFIKQGFIKKISIG